MSEHFLQRMKRVISAGVENAVDKAERAAAPSVMRQSIREVERMIDRTRNGQSAALARAELAEAQRQALREQIAELDEKARFAIAGKRSDLAEAALARQLDLETQAARLDQVEADARREAAECERSLPALEATKSEMDEQLAAFDAARRAAGPGSRPAGASNSQVEQSLERARQAFDRAMTAGSDPASRAELKVGEIDSLQREKQIAERLAALRVDKPKGKKSDRRG